MGQAKIMNETFSIEFDGKAFDNHEIPAAALAQSLLALDGLTKRAAEAVYGKEVEAEVRVKAGFKQGSFILDLIAACNNDPVTAVSVGAGVAAIAGTGVVPTIKNIIRLCKFAHGKKVDSQPDETQPEQFKVTNEAGQVNYFNACVVNLYNQSRTQSLMSRVTQTLDQEGVESIAIFDTSDGETREVITKRDREYFRREEGIVLTDNEAEVILEIVGPMTNGSPKGWKFSEGDDGIEFFAAVEDEDFLAKVRSREIKFENGTAVRAVLRTTQRKNIRTITDRTIVEVKEVISPSQNLF